MSARAIVKKRGRKPQEKVYSLINRADQPDTKIIPLKESLIVCLKVNRKLFNHLFVKRSILDETSFIDEMPQKLPKNPEQYSQILEHQNLIYNRLSIPDLYPEVMVEVEKSKVIFKKYHQLDITSINHQLNQQNNYKRIHLMLPTFESGWPEKSSYACWNCSEKFENSPIGLPVIHENRKYLEYRLEGNFCSFGCAARYLFENETGSAFWQRFDILNLLYNQMSESKELLKVELAPPRLALKKYGGQLSIEEYRRSQLTQKNYKVYRYPLKPCPYFLEETLPVVKSKTNPNYVSMDGNLKGIESRYKLSRKKPLPTKSYSIDQCMNIQIRKPTSLAV